MSNFHFLFDIDDTLTKYKPGALSKLICGNFLFPVLAELALKYGTSAEEAERKIHTVMSEKKEWDYPDFIHALRLPYREAMTALKIWHSENLDVHEDSIRLVHSLKEKGIPLSIISNNPQTGCLLKLERCGLADSFSGTSIFLRILSTEIMHGCKGGEGSWERALKALSPAPGCKIIMVGDNEREDCILPLAHGVYRAFLLNRNGRSNYSIPAGGEMFQNADEIMKYMMDSEFFEEPAAVYSK